MIFAIKASFNPFPLLFLFWHSPQNIRKPKIFLMFSGWIKSDHSYCKPLTLLSRFHYVLFALQLNSNQQPLNPKWNTQPFSQNVSQISRLFRARSSLTFRQTVEYEFTLKPVRDLIRTYSFICTFVNPLIASVALILKINGKSIDRFLSEGNASN